jgi:hypothetical protein
MQLTGLRIFRLDSLYFGGWVGLFSVWTELYVTWNRLTLVVAWQFAHRQPTIQVVSVVI